MSSFSPTDICNQLRREMQRHGVPQTIVERITDQLQAALVRLASELHEATVDVSRYRNGNESNRKEITRLREDRARDGHRIQQMQRHVEAVESKYRSILGSGKDKPESAVFTGGDHETRAAKDGAGPGPGAQPADQGPDPAVSQKAPGPTFSLDSFKEQKKLLEAVRRERNKMHKRAQLSEAACLKAIRELREYRDQVQTKTTGKDLP